MEKELTMSDILSTPEKILDISKNSLHNHLLSENVIIYYYNTELKKNIKKVFTKFKDLQYIVSLPSEYSIKSSSLDQVSIKTNSINDPVSKYVEKNIDLNIWTRDFYNMILTLSTKLTFNEAIYLVDTFFDERAEEQISEKLQICRKSLQKIKKSCLVKIKIEFSNHGFIY